MAENSFNFTISPYLNVRPMVHNFHYDGRLPRNPNRCTVRLCDETLLVIESYA